ncbi:MAG: hypothetical protein M3367_15070, partial [Acidobacteriota bacterium]|nr:hypothetical protein [Acidobacteriota bacterium]
RISFTKQVDECSAFFLFEFSISSALQNYSVEEILKRVIQDYVFSDEGENYQPESDRKTVAHKAFLIKKLVVEDFKKIQSSEIERIVLSELEKDEWNEADADAKDEYRKTFIKSKFLLDYLQIEKDAIFFIDKDWFDENEKLMEVHYIYDYLLTFAFINESKTRLLLVDYFYD